MEIKIMVVPGRVATVDLPEKATVVDAAKKAAEVMPNVPWLDLITVAGGKEREVRVQNKKFSNTSDVPEGYAGSVQTTPLEDGNVVLILTKIQGNETGIAVLTCYVNGEEYALETPVQVGKVLSEVAGIDLGKVKTITINGDAAQADQLVGDGDNVEIEFDLAAELAEIKAKLAATEAELAETKEKLAKAEEELAKLKKNKK